MRCMDLATRAQGFANDLQPCSRDNVKAALASLNTVHLVGALDLGKALAATASYVE